EGLLVARHHRRDPSMGMARPLPDVAAAHARRATEGTRALGLADRKGRAAEERELVRLRAYRERSAVAARLVDEEQPVPVAVARDLPGAPGDRAVGAVRQLRPAGRGELLCERRLEVARAELRRRAGVGRLAIVPAH